MVSIYSFFLVTLSITWAHAAKINITNNCPNTVWAAAVPGGGRKLDKGQTWTITAESGTKQARIWARTNCQFDASGKGKCETGDCNGLLECQGFGAAPNTLAEYALKQFNDMSNIDGFNVPMEFSSVSSSCNRVIKCTANILGECPNVLKVPGGCNGPCHVFKTDEYCCNSGNCGPTTFSRFFKERCPDVYSYPKDDATSTFTCPSGTDYKVVFCPSLTRQSKAKFNIINNCPNTVWAAVVSGGGRKLDKGQTWTITVKPGTTPGRIWARTNCQFDASGRGKCETGDCNGLLECQGFGAAPNTLAEYALKQFNDMDFIDMSNIDGFNVPLEFSSVSPSCNRVIKCTANILGECPNELKVPGGCNGPCPVFKTDEYCCNSGNCGPTNFSKFFKDRCPDVYSYPKDDATSAFTCPSGTDYKVVFCPSLTRQSN